MKKHILIWLAIGALAAPLAFVWFSPQEQPVVYQGKDVWAWTCQIESFDAGKRHEAAVALREIGADAVPLLLRKLRIQEPPLRQLRRWFGARVPVALGRILTRDLKPISYESTRSIAAHGLRAIGTNATRAVPGLLQAMRDPDRQVMWDAAAALSAIGGPAVLGLIPLVEDPKPQLRHAAIYALGEIGPDALPAVPALVRQLADPDPILRESAAYSLSRIGPLAGSVVLKLVTEERGQTRRLAAQALVKVRPRSVLAMPALIEMARDKEAESRSTAIDAIAALRISHTNALAVLRQSLLDTNAWVRASAARALGELCWKTRGDLPTLADLQRTDGDESVRLAAREAIGKITALISNTPPKLSIE